MFSFKTSLGASLLLLWLTSSVSAQVFNPTLTPGTIPITVQQSDEKAGIRPKVKDQRLVNIAFGATVNAGNSKTYAGNLGGRFGLIRDVHQVMVEALGTIGGARQGKFNDVNWTSRNVIARARYDLFLSQLDALFLAVAPRRDKFAGLDLRLQNQIGYLRNLFFPVDAHRVWSELGYDFTYDKFSAIEGATTTSTPMTAAMTGPTPHADLPIHSVVVPFGASKPDPYIHSARVFFGYTNRLSRTANLSIGLENLLDLKDKKNVRTNGLIELTSSITHTFKLGLQSRVLFDNVPVPGAKKYDAIAVAQLVYTFDSTGGPPGPCPACDCTAQVKAAQRMCGVAPPPVLLYEPLPSAEPTDAPQPASVPDSVPTAHRVAQPNPASEPISVPATPPVPTP